MTANWVTQFTRAQRQLIDEELASERHEPSTNQTRSFLIKISSNLMASQTHNTCCIAKTSCASVPVRSMDKRWELHAMPKALHPILLRFAVIAQQLYRSGLLISYFLLLDYAQEARACIQSVFRPSTLGRESALDRSTVTIGSVSLPNVVNVLAGCFPLVLSATVGRMNLKWMRTVFSE